LSFAVVQLNFSSGWPIEKGTPAVDSRAGARTAKLAIARRMEVLARVPLFAGLSKRQLQALARACSSHRWPAGSLIVAQGSSDQVCYILVEGTVEVVRGGQPIARLGPGDFFGEIALLDPGPRSASVTTATDVLAVRLPRPGFLDVALNDPQVVLRMLEALARRVRETTEKLSD
jgi:CRP/FNR family transcriptional regulator, cyclic AMP receptor protein